jgi:hypothetical protein
MGMSEAAQNSQKPKSGCLKFEGLTPKVLRGQILAFAGFGHVAMIRRCDMIFWEFYSR